MINLCREIGDALLQEVRGGRCPDGVLTEGLLEETDDGGRALSPSVEDGAMIDERVHQRTVICQPESEASRKRLDKGRY
jgi:hypothetical protein